VTISHSAGPAVRPRPRRRAYLAGDGPALARGSGPTAHRERCPEGQARCGP